MGVIRSRGFVPSFSPFVSDPKSEPSVIRSGFRCSYQPHMRSPLVGGRTNIPLTGGQGLKRTRPIFRSAFSRPEGRDGRPLGSAGTDQSSTLRNWVQVIHQFNFDLSGLHYCPLDDDASCDVFPKCDEKLSSTFAGDTLLEPMTEQRIRLMSQPQPGQLDHGCPQPRVSRFGDPLFAVGHPTLPWCWRKSGVSANLSPVVKVAE